MCLRRRTRFVATSELVRAPIHECTQSCANVCRRGAGGRGFGRRIVFDCDFDKVINRQKMLFQHRRPLPRVMVTTARVRVSGGRVSRVRVSKGRIGVRVEVRLWLGLGLRLGLR